MPGNNLFSKEAMDKLRSPEKLDMLLEVTNPVSWMALASMIVMVFSVIVWSVFGAMIVKVEGVGILLDSGGVVTISAPAQGRVEEIFVATGERVRKGDLLMMMDQPEQNVESSMARFDMYLSENSREALVRAAQYDSKRYQQDLNSYVFSRDDGIVDEISVEHGSTVSAGSTVCTIRRDEERDELAGVLYVPANKGKQIEPGMTVQLAPNGIDTSEEGSLVAVVRSVSQYPVSSSSMMNRLGNQQLVQWMLSKADNAVMEINFDLVKDEESASGYLWTSIVGKHKPVTAGSVCSGSVIVDRKPPIEKVFYKLSQWLRRR